MAKSPICLSNCGRNRIRFRQTSGNVMAAEKSLLPPFSAPYAPDDGAISALLLTTAKLGAERELRIDRTATRLIEAIRADDDPLGGVEDMLGEGARTADDAERYFNSYARAIDAIGRAADDRPLPDRPGISVKLSALHPRFEAVSAFRVMTELVPRLIELAQQAKAYDLNFTVDAEEADRL